MKRFPSVKALAGADLQDVLKAWEGLGYYTRARNLHAAAKQIVQEHHGRMPGNSEALRRLPGIGDYTAAAIASIVHGEPVPTVDGNVLRVMSRFLADSGDISKPAMRSRVAEYLREHIVQAPAGDFNQAMMELGALVCRPRNPRCEACPLRTDCKARKAGKTEKYPVKAASPKSPERVSFAGILYRRGNILLAQRREDQLLGGLWEFPGGWREGREKLSSGANRAIAESTGLGFTVGRRLAVVQHVFSHFRLTLHVFACQEAVGRTRAGAEAQRLRWISPGDIHDFPLTKTSHKVIAALGGLEMLDELCESHHS